ncbi:MAG: hypothetical protein II369_00230, partial [Clostridia bacterium]|nr:hypothetical protein [Clostridia bacterium]
MSKNLLEIFSRYTPGADDARILLLADPSSIALRADKEKRMIEVKASFGEVIPKQILYRIEEEIRKAYQLQSVRIYPRYPSQLFDRDRIPDLLIETNRRGIVANGFFNHCDFRLSNESLTIEIPFSEGGVSLMYDAKTPQLMEQIVQEEFGVAIKVNIHRMDAFDASLYENSVEAQIKELAVQAARAEAEYRRMQEAPPVSGNAPSEVEEKEILPRAASIYDEDFTAEITEEGKCRIGALTFDLSAPSYVIGEPFEIRPIPISTIDSPRRNLVIIGEIFGFQKEASRTEGK